MSILLTVLNGKLMAASSEHEEHSGIWIGLSLLIGIDKPLQLSEDLVALSSSLLDDPGGFFLED